MASKRRRPQTCSSAGPSHQGPGKDRRLGRKLQETYHQHRALNHQFRYQYPKCSMQSPEWGCRKGGSSALNRGCSAPDGQCALIRTSIVLRSYSNVRLGSAYLLLITRAQILAFTLGLVAATIFHVALEDCGCDGSRARFNRAKSRFAVTIVL